jgi:hypothetical protein
VQITACTWDKDSQNLYDNENRSIFKSSLQLTSSASVFLENNICKQYIPRISKLKLPGNEPLLGFKLTQTDCSAYQIGTSSNKQLWQSVRYSHSKGIELKENDTIKFGRIRVKVKKIVLKCESSDDDAMSYVFDSLAQFDTDFQAEEDASCRICFQTNNTLENPLLSPCECTGSIKYIHAECIREWVKSRIQTKNTKYTRSYYWSDLMCELCKTSLPSSVYYRDVKISLISIEYPVRPYILLEEFSPDTITSCGMHIVTLEEGAKIHVGRSPDVHLKISDLSVSRKHATISFTGQKFYISDKKSKFGTLIKLKKVVNLEIGEKMAIQVGRTLFHVCLKKRVNLLNCCCLRLTKIAPELSYITQEGIEHSGVGLNAAEMQSAHREGTSLRLHNE